MKLGVRLEISLLEAWEFSLLFIGWHVCTCFVLQSLSMVSLSPQMCDGFLLSSNVACMHVLCTSIVINGFPLSSNVRWLPALLKCAIQQADVTARVTLCFGHPMA
jgi:hypothetical protein